MTTQHADLQTHTPRYQQCSRKRRYAKRHQAESVARYQTGLTGDTLRIYSCPFCHGFHITKKDVQ